MKKLVIVIAAALAGIFSGAAQDLKFGHVNFMELVQLMPEADEARAKMQAANQDARETLQSMMQEAQSKYQTYQEKAAGWSESVRSTKQREIQDIQSRIEEFQQSVQQELQQQNQQLMAPIYEKATKVVGDIAKERGCLYVFDVTNLLYFDASRSMDLTADARKALNIPESRTMESLQAELQAAAAAVPPGSPSSENLRVPSRSE